jgi:outer membrane protein TolC
MASAQGRNDLDSLVTLALAANPGLHAAQFRVDAARDRVGPAGARPDPMLTAGIVNLPIRQETATSANALGAPTTTAMRDPMTMQMVGVSQTFPYAGKLALATRASRDELAASEAELGAARLDVAMQVKRAYYTLADIESTLGIVARTEAVVAALTSASEARYTTGNGVQADVLRARVEAAHLGEQASELQERRRAELAQLNALLERPDATPIESAAIPERIVRAAVADSAAHVRFVSAILGARAADSPLFSIDSLQALAVANSPMLRAHESRIAAQSARVELARKAYLPDVNMMLSYGHRPGLVDMVSATVSVPIAIQKGRKQDAGVDAAEAELAALEAEHHRVVNELHADVARQVASIERARTQLAISVRAILPQSRAALTSATSEYQVGRLDFGALMDAQASVFNAETAYYHSLTAVAIGFAELERTVGTGVLK